MTIRTLDAAATAGAGGARLVPALLAAGLGVALILLAGFVQGDVLHDAAHDIRHASGFPCH